MRESIFEIVNKKKDIKEDISRLLYLLNQKCIRTSSDDVIGIADIEFIKWKNRGTCIGIDDMANQLNIVLDYRRFDRINISYEEQLNYIEFICNIVMLSNKTVKKSNVPACTNYTLLLENIDKLLNSLNYRQQYIKDTDRVLICENDRAVTAVVELLNKDLSYEIIEYNHYLARGNIELKKSILLKIYDDYCKIEEKIKSYNSSIYDDISFLINNLNVRHNNLEGKDRKEITAQMNKEELEIWYDEIYQLFLFAFLYNEHITNRKPKIKELKDKFDKK